jgi:histidinol dehydrogenase
MAFGTKTIPAVDKIFGPGNAYVCEAKRQVFGTVGVDSLPGPSEVMVIADASARPDWAAADLLAQAEHGSGREKIYLVSTSERVIEAVRSAVDAQLESVSRADKIRTVLGEGFLAIRAKSVGQMAEIANAVAPEHLELMVKDSTAAGLVRGITTAGAIMIGHETPTVLGDFVAGPSHVLPTARAGRYFGGLRVSDFLRRTSLIRYDRASLRRAYPTVAAFSAMERLDAHGRSAEIRLRG